MIRPNFIFQLYQAVNKTVIISTNIRSVLNILQKSILSY